MSSICRMMLVFVGLLSVCAVLRAEDSYLAPGNANPILPGYYADPTIRKFGDTWYLYPTTDGTSFRGLPTVWTSKDFVNWTCHRFPRFYESDFFWAPDVVQRDDGRFFLLHSHPCMVYGFLGDSPFGPWKSVTPGKPLVPDQLVKNVITLDGQTFRDNDGSWYITWCTWAIFPNNGCGVGKLSPDFASFTDLFQIPNTQAEAIFEGPFLFRRNGTYYLTYSCERCENETYHLRYATSDNVRGPYKPGRTNPILKTSTDKTVNGPGHHSLIDVGDGGMVCVYHRHNIPATSNGGNRQVCADRMVFEDDGAIRPIVPTHKGIGALAPNTNPLPNLALCKPVKASSEMAPDYKAAYAVDDNNATLWRPANAVDPAWLEVDLGSVQRICRIHTQFEYATYFYQYLLETSKDGKSWSVFSDKRGNRQAGSPMVDCGDVEARYVRLSVTGTEMTGWLGAIWNLKVFGGIAEDPPQEVVHLEAEDLAAGALQQWDNSLGMLGGSFKAASKNPQVSIVEGRKAVVFDGKTSLASMAALPSGLAGRGAYTLAAWVLSQEKNQGSVWDGGRLLPSLAVADGKWHFIAVTHDGRQAKLFVDGKPHDDAARVAIQDKPPVSVSAAPQPLVIGRDFVGAIAAVRVFNRALWPSEIAGMVEEKYVPPTKPFSGKRQGLVVRLEAEELAPQSVVECWPNRGKLGGAFMPAHGKGAPRVDVVSGVKSVVFDGKSLLASDASAPASLSGNSPFTAAAWVFNPAIQEAETVLSWTRPGGDNTAAALRYGSGGSGATLHWGWSDMGWKGGAPQAGAWHHIAMVFDGAVERVYIDGKQNDSEVKMLWLRGEGRICVGAADEGGGDPLSGAVASLRLYDMPLGEAEIMQLAAERPSSDITAHLDTKSLPYGPVKDLPNQGAAGGDFTCSTGDAAVADVGGRIALAFDGKQSMAARKVKAPKSGTLLVIANGHGGAAASIGGAKLTPTDGGWRHLAVTWTPAGATRYMDGAATGAATAPTNQDPLVLGEGFSGGVTLCQVFGGAMSADAVKAAWSAWQRDGEPPKPNPAALIASPQVVTPTMVMLEAAQATDVGGGVQWCFTETTTGVSSGWLDQPAWRQDGLKPDAAYAYTVKTRDALGNVGKASSPEIVRTDSSRFTVFNADFTKARDLKKESARGTSWDGVFGADNATAVQIENGRLRLESPKSYWIDQEPKGVLVYKIVEGDFTAEVEVAELMGSAKREAIGNQSGGLLARVADLADAGPGENLLLLSVFPAWGCGNITTSFANGGRPEWSPRNGWEYGRFLQMQRSGDRFFLRYSKDGKAWTDMPGSPVQRDDLHGLPLQVGMQHNTHGGEKGWAEFQGFRIYQPMPNKK